MTRMKTSELALGCMGMSDFYGASDEEEVPFRVGQRVRHATFGEGEVRGWTGYGPSLKLTVYFRSTGLKTIVARFVEPV